MTGLSTDFVKTIACINNKCGVQRKWQICNLHYTTILAVRIGIQNDQKLTIIKNNFQVNIHKGQVLFMIIVVLSFSALGIQNWPFSDI